MQRAWGGGGGEGAPRIQLSGWYWEGRREGAQKVAQGESPICYKIRIVNNPVKMITRANVNMRDLRLVPLDVSIMGFAF